MNIIHKQHCSNVPVVLMIKNICAVQQIKFVNQIHTRIVSKNVGMKNSLGIALGWNKV